ncbi:MAG: hypothetical protein AVDCRST_MAG57-615, partial [uncultured Blastococcus sp.]
MTEHGSARDDLHGIPTQLFPGTPRRLPARLRGRRPLAVPSAPARAAGHGRG